jgi:peptidoglycan hydrolase-like protein with peptidoglycan-binding domain
MDPIDEPTGVRKRLEHLGFYKRDPAEDAEAADARSLRAYQAARGLPQTGQPDDATKAALLKDHGS